MKKHLEGRVALVTGASRGIGAAVAEGFAREGAHVILLARKEKDLEAVYDKITAGGGKATILPFDLSQTDKIPALGPAIAEKFRRLDILVGNAAILGDLSPVALSDPKTWEKTWRLNVLANVQLIRALDPLLRGSDAGRAMFVTSGAAQMDLPFWGPYASSKAALERVAGAYGQEVEYSGLRVGLIDPGEVRTEMHAEAFPGLDPKKLPPPESVVEKFIAFALPGKPAAAHKPAAGKHRP